MSEDKRSQQRRRILKDGRVLLPGSRVSYDCAIRDLSETGAKLRLQLDSITLPNEFELVFVAEGLAHPVILKWQRGREAGVAFNGPPRPVKVRIA
jgi:hypothetical protein